MVQINFAQKQVNAKIVYYGPGMSGKTTNLEVVHQRAPEQNKGELTSISTDGDRTLFFDFMPLDLGTVAGMRTCFQIYTVPGQVYYNSTRKLVLQGVDGVVFVADSSASMLEENLVSLRNLEENLNEYGKSLAGLPHVIQYNKRDLPDAMPVPEIESHLNLHGAPSFEAVANTGQGVFPTLKALAARVLESIHSGSGAGGGGAPRGPSAPAPRAPLPRQSAASPAAMPAAAAAMRAPERHARPAHGAAPAQSGGLQMAPGAHPRPAAAQVPEQPAHGAPAEAMPQPRMHAPPAHPSMAGGTAGAAGVHESAFRAQAGQPQAPAGGYAPPAPPAGMHQSGFHPRAAPGGPAAGGLHLAPRSAPERQTAPAPQRSDARRPGRAQARAGGPPAPSALEGTRFRPRNPRPDARPTPAGRGAANGRFYMGIYIALALVVGGLLTRFVFSFF